MQMPDVFVSYNCACVHSSCRTVIPIYSVDAETGSIAAEQLLMCHALTVCDTTSTLYGQQKASAFRKTAASEQFLNDTSAQYRLYSSRPSFLHYHDHLIVQVVVSDFESAIWTAVKKCAAGSSPRQTCISLRSGYKRINFLHIR